MDEDFQLFACFRLADVFRQRTRAQRALDLFLNGTDGGGGDEAVGFDHGKSGWFGLASRSGIQT